MVVATSLQLKPSFQRRTLTHVCLAWALHPWYPADLNECADKVTLLNGTVVRQANPCNCKGCTGACVNLRVGGTWQMAGWGRALLPGAGAWLTGERGRVPCYFLDVVGGEARGALHVRYGMTACLSQKVPKQGQS